MQAQRQVRLNGAGFKTATEVGFHPIVPAGFPSEIRLSQKRIGFIQTGT